jgi:hypothetical protein
MFFFDCCTSDFFLWLLHAGGCNNQTWGLDKRKKGIEGSNLLETEENGGFTLGYSNVARDNPNMYMCI